MFRDLLVLRTRIVENVLIPQLFVICSYENKSLVTFDSSCPIKQTEEILESVSCVGLIERAVSVQEV